MSTRLSVLVRRRRSNSRSPLQLVCARPVGTSPNQAKKKWDVRGLVKRLVAEKERAASSPPWVSVFASVVSKSAHAHYNLGAWNSLRSSTTDSTNPANRLYGLIALRAVIIYRPETQTNKLKLTLANSSLLSVFCHYNVMFVCLLSLKWEKWQNSDKNGKLVTLASFAHTLLHFALDIKSNYQVNMIRGEKSPYFFAQSMDRFHMTSRRPLVHETMKRLPCWFIEKLLWVFNSFLM